jgi:uncharacterized protein with FMN-binding domain
MVDVLSERKHKMKKRTNKILSLLLATTLTATMLLTGCGNSSQTADTAAEVSEESSEETPEDASASEAIFPAGEYEGVGTGKNGDIKVKVTLSDTKIENVEVLEQAETEGLGDVAIEDLIPAILESQTVDVDSVSGATVTSDGLKEAVTNALAEAGVDASTLSGSEE